MKLIHSIFLAISFLLLSVSIATANNFSDIYTDSEKETKVSKDKSKSTETILLDESYQYIPISTIDEGKTKTVLFQIVKDGKLQSRYIEVIFTFYSERLLSEANFSYTNSNLKTTMLRNQVTVLLRGKGKDSPTYKLENLFSFYDVAKDLAHVNVL